MKQPDDISDGYDAEDNSRKSYDLAIATMRERLASFRRERIGDCTLYLGDCMDVLPLLLSADAIVTDPPYGVGKAAWDGEFPTAWYGIAREKATTVYTMPGNIALADCVRMVGDDYKDVIALWLSNGMTLGPLGFGNWIPVVVSQKSRKHLGGQNAFRVVVDVSEKIDHPSPKPLAGMKALLSQHGGSVVIDPFMGSGTTGIACAMLGRRFFGIEINPSYFDIACRRIDEAYKQPDMFVAPPSPAPIQISLLEPEPMTSKDKAAQQKALTVDGSRIIAEAKKREEHEATMLVEAAIEAAAPSNLDAREEWDRLRKLDQAVEDMKLMTKGLRYVRRGRVESVALVARPGVGRQLAAEVASVMDRPIDLGAPDPEAPEYIPPAIKAAPVVERKKRRAKAQ